MPRIEEDIKKDVVDQLAWDDRVNAAAVEVEVCESTVVLHGSVPSYWSKTAAVEDAELVPGVDGVDDQLAVRWPPVYSPGDSDLRDNVDRALRWNPNIDMSRITIDVFDGNVSLEGTVDSLWKKLHVERAASDVAGVTRVENRLAVVPTGNYADDAIARYIVAALKRNSMIDAERVEVTVADGVVTFRGSVPNPAGRRFAREIARRTAGVVDVHDKLSVAV